MENEKREREREKRKDLSSEVFENAFFADAVFEAELFPELHSDLIPALPHLQSDNFSRHFFFSIYPEWKIKLGFLDGRKCETKESTLAVVLVLFEKVIREGNIRDEISESRELWWHLYTVKTEAWTLTESHSLTSVCLIKLELSG